MLALHRARVFSCAMARVVREIVDRDRGCAEMNSAAPPVVPVSARFVPSGGSKEPARRLAPLLLDLPPPAC